MDSDWMETLPELVNEEPIRVRPSHQQYVNRPQLRSFFMPEIQCLSIFPAILTLSRSTDFNVYLLTDVGIDDGISDSIMLVLTGKG